MKHTGIMYLITITALSAFSFELFSNPPSLKLRRTHPPSETSGDIVKPLKTDHINAAISYGELVDKITILTIKSERITNSEKLKNILIELTSLLKTFDEYIGDRTDVEELKTLLKEVNEILWDIEDDIRVKERNKEFDNEFIQLARGVYSTNDKRMSLKKQIDTLMGSHITEEKSYEAYT